MLDVAAGTGNAAIPAVLAGAEVVASDLTPSLLEIDRFAGGAQFRDFFKSRYGPTVAAYRNLAGDPDRVAALDRDLADLGGRYDRGDGVMHWDYLLWTGRRSG